MSHLFSPLKIARVRLSNRIALAPLPSGYADASGFFNQTMVDYYLRRAQGGVGLLLPEPASVEPPVAAGEQPHLGLYHDGQISTLASFVRAAHQAGAQVILPLESAATRATAPAERLDAICELFLQAGWRALAAGCDGVMLSAADGGLLHSLISPLRNQRTDHHGGNLDGRLHLALEVVEGLRRWFGKRLLVAFRINADEMTAGGMTLQDTRMIAHRLTKAGVGLVDITLVEPPGVQIARFPGWRVPFAAAIKRVLPDVPVMTSGSLGDPLLADSVIREGSADLVMLGHTLRIDPDWPQRAYATLRDRSEGMLI